MNRRDPSQLWRQPIESILLARVFGLAQTVRGGSGGGSGGGCKGKEGGAVGKAHVPTLAAAKNHNQHTTDSRFHSAHIVHTNWYARQTTADGST